MSCSPNRDRKVARTMSHSPRRNREVARNSNRDRKVALTNSSFGLNPKRQRGDFGSTTPGIPLALTQTRNVALPNPGAPR